VGDRVEIYTANVKIAPRDRPKYQRIAKRGRAGKAIAAMKKALGRRSQTYDDA
jgi:hypothetical protein